MLWLLFNIVTEDLSNAIRQGEEKGRGGGIQVGLEKNKNSIYGLDDCLHVQL